MLLVKQDGARPGIITWVRAAVEQLLYAGRVGMCQRFGHKWDKAINPDPENGTEDLICGRCGHSHTCWF